jgi:hypothetical protein
MRLRAAVVVTIAAALLAACNGKGVAPLPPAGNPSASVARAPHGSATLTISLPPIQPVNQPYPWASSTAPPSRLSAATASISGVLGGRQFGPIALGSGTAACPNASPNTPLQCSITLPTALGSNVSLSLTTHAASSVSALALATGSQRVHVYAGTNYKVVSLLGIAQKVATRLMPSNLRAGRYASVPIVVYGIDAGGTAIPGQIANPAQVSVRLSGFVNENFSQNCYLDECEPIVCCGVISAFDYDGLATGRETIRTTSTINYNPVTSYVTVKPGNQQLATLLVGINSSTGSFLTSQFVSSAAGNVAPVRTVQVPSPLFGEDAQGNYWAGSTHYSNQGTVLGSVKLASNAQPVAIDARGHLYSSSDCGFSEYPAHRYGVLRPIRSVACSGARSGYPVVDDAGNVYVTLEYANAAATILEYGPNGGSGDVPPIRTIATPYATYATYVGLGFDARENLYAVLDGGAPYVGQRMFEFAPGATTGQQILPNIRMLAFTVDAAGDIYAAVQTAEGAPVTLEEFPPGSTTPSRVVAGPKTGLTDGVYPILVPR